MRFRNSPLRPISQSCGSVHSADTAINQRGRRAPRPVSSSKSATASKRNAALAGPTYSMSVMACRERNAQNGIVDSAIAE